MNPTIGIIVSVKVMATLPAFAARKFCEPLRSLSINVLADMVLTCNDVRGQFVNRRCENSVKLNAKTGLQADDSLTASDC
jgi:hypothetical protein